MTFRPNLTFIADAAAGSAILGSLVGWLPTIAAVVGLVWYCIQIWESRTMQRVKVRYHRWWRVNRKGKFDKLDVAAPPKDDFDEG